MNKMLMKEKNVEKEKKYWVISESNLTSLLFSSNYYAENCYECIKTEQDWSFNQFAVNASEFSA